MNNLKLSFTITFYFLIFACFLSIVSLFFIKSKKLRNILCIETIITGFAVIIYSFYLKHIDKYNLTYQTSKDWLTINQYRYIDWTVTTPLMLISLILILSHDSSIVMKPLFILLIVLLDWIMLFLGYLGESKKISRLQADIFGFIPLAIIFYLIYSHFIKRKGNLLFTVYVIIWSMYGILYMFNEQTMNTLFNLLDCIAKAFVCIYICLYIWKYKE
jgi:bacteriorhodopsin